MRHGLPIAASVALGLILSTPAWAVSVGDIRPQSRVGEPLQVNIAIIDSDGITDDSIQIVPASAADHALLGMQRPAWLDQMVFRSERDSNGQLVVNGSAPVLPPSSEQNFLVQLSWPGHVRLQQVSVSLPPANATLPKPAAVDPADAVAISLPTPVDASAPTLIPAQATAPENTVIPAQPQQMPPASAMPTPIVERPAQTLSGPISVRRGDTLSQIASEWDHDLSLNQRQQIIHDHNPNAFIDGNINRLRADVRINLPDPNSVQVPTERAANRWYRQALKQAEGLLSAELKKPVINANVTESEEAATEPNLTLVAPGQGEGSGAAAGHGADADAVSNALTEAESERASLLAKRLQLRERLAALTSANADADRRLQVLDERLAAMEAGEPLPAEAAAEPSVEPNNGWMWWLAAGFFWLLLLVVWLRQRAQRQQAELDSARKEPMVASDDVAVPAAAAALSADVADAPAQPQVPSEFDDTFANLAPTSSTLGDYADTEVVEEEYDFLSDSDAEAYQTRLDLAQAYLDMNEDDAARQLLERVVEGGSSEQRARAQALIDAMG